MMRVIVIGGVAAGMSAAAKLKRTLGDEVAITVFEKGRDTSYGACGLPFFLADIVKEPDRLVERTPEQFTAAGIAVHVRHEVTAVDTAGKTVTVRDLGTVSDSVHEYDKLIVASGARVRRFPPMDEDRVNLFSLRTIADGVGIKAMLARDEVRNVIVVGAGFIGLEVAEACARRGKNVTVVEFADRILSVMDPVFTDRLAEELQANGVALRTESKLADLETDGGRIVSAVVESASGRDVIPADLVLNCAGIVPNAEFIDVAKTVNGAIIVDGNMRTSAPDVYAAGDCSVMTSFITREHLYSPLGTNANKQGRIIAQVLSGGRVPPFRLLGSSTIRVFGLDAAKVGLSELDAVRLNLDYKSNTVTANSYASYYAPGTVMVKLIYDASSRRLLGAQTLGQGVVAARANYFAVAISAGMTVDEFGFLDLCYSPPFGGVWDATLIAANTAR